MIPLPSPPLTLRTGHAVTVFDDAGFHEDRVTEIWSLPPLVTAKTLVQEVRWFVVLYDQRTEKDCLRFRLLEENRYADSSEILPSEITRWAEGKYLHTCLQVCFRHAVAKELDAAFEDTFPEARELFERTTPVIL